MEPFEKNWTGSKALTQTHERVLCTSALGSTRQKEQVDLVRCSWKALGQILGLSLIATSLSEALSTSFYSDETEVFRG